MTVSGKRMVGEVTIRNSLNALRLFQEKIDGVREKKIITYVGHTSL